MSRFHPDWDIKPILTAAEHWKRVALESQGSVFGDESIWTNENLDALQKFFVENLDFGEGNFMSKLEGQLRPTGPGTKKLMAEMMWFMFLCPSNIGSDNKRQNILETWSWSDAPRPSDSRWLSDNVLRGVGSAGTAFNTQRWREVVFFVKFMRAFRELESSSRSALLADGWQFAEWMESIPEAGNRQLRHMILYLLFPDSFDRIFGRSNRRKLLSSFTNMSGPQIRAMSALEVSREIQKIRKQWEEQEGTAELDFYITPLKERWKFKKPKKPKDRKRTPFEEQTKGVTRQHVLQALKEIDRDDFAPDARSSTYDLIYGSNRYPPKYVLSLAVKYATGELFPRTFFSGGEDSQAFRLLRDRGFSIERKDFIRELIKNFVEQADEGTNLVVSAYPKSYRDLKLNVSFGKGNFARIPWISYTGYRQKTNEGIYPVVLYYKSIGILIVAYGISETNKPDFNWKELESVPKISEYLQEKYGIKPVRYGSSFVHAAFDMAEQVDDVDIQHAIDKIIGKYHAQFAEFEPSSGGEEPPTHEPYGVEEALESLFIDEEKFVEILDLIRVKKNLILQGPPGVGKTFACKRLAYALMEEKAENRLGMIQFHQSYSYEDFIQGYRPSGTGFRLKNGVFYEFCDEARDDPANTYVFIIDELNRGNLSKVFGEIMMLIEPDKRGPEWAIPLTYSESSDDKFYIPENLYLIGLMNTADRSLAMVDYALRRRFVFADLRPGFETDQFKDYLEDLHTPIELIEEIVAKMARVNRVIAEDTTNLGPGFCIGHSFFCTMVEGVAPDWNWFSRIIKTEIEPLLREYYFDDVKQADSLVEMLLRRS